jgi:polyisoprenoid-binding protein YceI
VDRRASHQNNLAKTIRKPSSQAHNLIKPRSLTMRKLTAIFVTSLAVAVAVPIVAQQMPTEAPGKADPSRVVAGTYSADPYHTLVGWRVNHMGFNDYFGQFGDVKGTLVFDPATPSKAKLDVTIPIASLSTASADLTKHMLGADFFDSSKYPEARFVSTSVKVNGTNAVVTGNLTLRGVTKSVTLQASFVGAGTNVPQAGSKKTIGFHATGTVNRGDFGMGYGLVMVPDPIKLELTAAFEKQD